MAAKAGLAMERGLVRAGERVCVAVSGGADSVALLMGLVEANAFGAQNKEPLGVVLSAAHVHHGLRGAEADGDEVFVRELCERLGVPVTVFRVDTAARQAEEGEGLEEAARELRYAALRGMDVDAIATAHTMDDQAETVVMKLLRGAWTEGLGGVSPVVSCADGEGVIRKGLRAVEEQSGSGSFNFATRDKATSGYAQDDSARNKGRIVRPLLGVRRVEVEAFLRELGQEWREDSSNKDVSLMRNRVRHELMPMLRGFNPRVDGLLANVATIARDEEAHWEAELGRILPQIVMLGKPVRGGGRAVSTTVGESVCAVEVERLKGMDAALRRRVVRGVARTMGIRLTFEETAKVLALAGFGGYAGVTGKIGSRLELRGGVRVERSAREIRLWRQG